MSKKFEIAVVSDSVEILEKLKLIVSNNKDNRLYGLFNVLEIFDGIEDNPHKNKTMDHEALLQIHFLYSEEDAASFKNIFIFNNNETPIIRLSGLNFSESNFNVNSSTSMLTLRFYFEVMLVLSMLRTSRYSFLMSDKYIGLFTDIFQVIATNNNMVDINPYHNAHHCGTVATNLFLGFRWADYVVDVKGEKKYEELFYNIVAALFHDINYDPHLSEEENENNALNSIEVFYMNRNLPKPKTSIKKIKEIITKGNELFLSDISHWVRTPDEIIEIEKLIFKEYGFVSWYEYKNKRICILKEIQQHLRTKYEIERGTLPYRLAEGIELSLGWLVGLVLVINIK